MLPYHRIASINQHTSMNSLWVYPAACAAVAWNSETRETGSKTVSKLLYSAVRRRSCSCCCTACIWDWRSRSPALCCCSSCALYRSRASLSSYCAFCCCCCADACRKGGGENVGGMIERSWARNREKDTETTTGEGERERGKAEGGRGRKRRDHHVCEV